MYPHSVIAAQRKRAWAVFLDGFVSIWPLWFFAAFFIVLGGVIAWDAWT